jgi:para-nitrobenzyl esterase
MDTRHLALVWLLITLACPITRGQPAPPTVSVEGGRIRAAATEVPGVWILRAVPFAAPPVRPDRWRAPQPVVAWSGVRNSDSWPNRCYQLASANPPGSFYFNEFYWDPAKDPKDSEDCLYLNIWLPESSAAGPAPVLVFFHGGGNRHGNDSEVEFNAAKLAQKGVIVVSAPYRLNIMGFLALPGMTDEGAGNFAILDAVEALKWVRKNIRALGGDPGRVTVMGQSAGSRNVRTLLSTPLAEGLFQRAIMHSSPSVMAQPGKANYLTLEQKETAGAAVFQKYFPGQSIEALRQLPVEAFYQDPAKIEELYAATSGTYAVIDGKVLTRESVDLLKPGALHGVDVILGTVADERTALDDAPLREMDVDAFDAYWKKQLGDELYAKYQFEKLYPVRNRSDAYLQHRKAQADLLLEQDRIAGSLLKARNPGSKVYVFYFDHATPGRDREYYGSWHSSDLWYVLDSLRNEPGQRHWAPSDFELAEQASSLWANFVKTGDPNGAGLPAWQQSQPGNNGAYLRFGEKSTGMSSGSPYAGTSAESRNALFHDYEMGYYALPQ